MFPTVCSSFCNAPMHEAALRNPSPAVHAAAAIALLTVALVLSVYKPRGLTVYGYRWQRATAAS